MDGAQLRNERDRLAREHGPWRDRIALGEGVTTLEQNYDGEEWRTQTVLQAVGDTLGKELSEISVLDLGAAEGRHAVEFASHGARVVALEGRQGNVDKALFVRQALGLDDRLTVVQADVRELSAEAHGRFDAVLCLGLLYHLDAQSAVAVVRAMADVTTRLAVIDTHIARSPKETVTVEGRRYAGRRVREFDPDEATDEQERLSRSSIGNPESFWFTRASLLNALSHAGFTSVHEILVPRFARPSDRFVALALKGERRSVITAPGGADIGVPAWPERERARPSPSSTWRGAMKLKLAPYAPAILKRAVRRRRDSKWRPPVT